MLNLTYKDEVSCLKSLIAIIVALISTITFLQATKVRAKDIASEGFKQTINETDFPALSGAKAIQHLKSTGEYESLTEALRIVQGSQITNPQNILSSRTFEQTAKLTAYNGGFNNFFGTGIAIEGDTAVVTSPGYSEGSNIGQGAVYVFTRRGRSWFLHQQLRASDARSFSTFGSTVALNGDTLFVGAYGDNIGSNQAQGSVYVFTRSGTIWTERQKLVASDGAPYDAFASGISIMGNTAVIGAYNDDEGAGAAYVFVLNGTTWIQQQKLVASDRLALDYFGWSVAIDGETIVVGANEDDNGEDRNQGSAYVFVRNGTNWAQLQKLTAWDEVPFSTAEFGISVDISRDFIVIGAWSAPVGGESDHGAAYIFVRNGTTWTKLQKLTASDGTRYDYFGRSVAIDGDYIVVGAPDVDFGDNMNQGAAYAFTRTGNTWTQQAKLVAPDGARVDYFGRYADVSNGTIIVASTDDDIGTNSDQGSLYIFLDTTNAPNLQAASDTGFSNSDDITTSRSLVFDINGVTAGATVELLRDGIAVATTIANSSNITLTDSNAPANGNFRYVVRQILANNTNLEGAATIVTVDTQQPTVTINQALNQSDPTRFLPINFSVVFSEPIVGFDAADISLSASTANVANASVSVTGSGAIYNVAVNNVTSNGGSIKVTIPAVAATDPAGNENLASTSTDNTVTIDNVAPTVTINQAINQADPTSGQPINFTVVFSEPVTGFNRNDIFLTGSSAGVSSANIVVTGEGTTYNVAVSNITRSGQVTARVVSNAAQDIVGNLSAASTSTDNTISFIFKPAPFDYDGDGRADISVFRPTGGAWYISRSSNNSFFGTNFGQSGDVIAPADFDGDGRTDISVFRQGFWYRLNSSTNQFVGLQFGIAEDIPVPSDYDGDGRADVAVFRPSNSIWYRINSTNNEFIAFKWGTSGDKPLIGDFDGDKRADYAVFRPSAGAWYILRSVDNSFYGINFGISEDIPTPADYDGDGKTDISVFRPSAGSWYRLNSSNNQFFGQQFGISEDKPVAADYDGDGRADIAVFRPSVRTWYIQRSASGFFAQQFGTNGDIPTASAFGQ